MAQPFRVEQRVVRRQDRPAGNAEDRVDAHLFEGTDERLRSGHLLGHDQALCRWWTRRNPRPVGVEGLRAAAVRDRQPARHAGYEDVAEHGRGVAVPLTSVKSVRRASHPSETPHRLVKRDAARGAPRSDSSIVSRWVAHGVDRGIALHDPDFRIVNRQEGAITTRLAGFRDRVAVRQVHDEVHRLGVVHQRDLVAAQSPSLRVHGHGLSQAICASTAGSTALPHMCRPHPCPWSP